jgi:hypothetical protein
VPLRGIVPARAVSGTDGVGWGGCFNPAAPSTVGTVGCTGQGRGRLRSLCLVNVTVIVKLEAFLGGNVPQAASGAVVINLA